MTRSLLVTLAGAVLLAACDTGAPCTDPPLAPDAPAAASYVVHVSIDGLRPDAVTGQVGELPTFTRLRTEGAFTDNARTDVDFRKTLPNHSAQLTGRPTMGPSGHGWTENSDPLPWQTLHSNHGAYVASVFDVAHDRGLRTAAYVSKSKFVLFARSYDGEHGAPDTTGADDGRGKIDTYVYEDDTAALVQRLVGDLDESPAAYTFVHLRDPDSAGHASGWDLTPGSPYLRAVQRADALLGQIVDAVESDPRLAGRTALVVTADHGGLGTDHGPDIPEDYTVPFYVWGAGVGPGDLYAANASDRRDPARDQVPADAPRQPVRNGDAANLALRLLGLPPVPCSTTGADVPLRVRPVAPGVSPTTTPLALARTP